MLTHFYKKPFMWHKAPGFPQHALLNTYGKEEASFKETVSRVLLGYVRPTANVMCSHVIYKVNVADDNVLSLKASIAPHGNEDSIKQELRYYCVMGSPVGMRVLIITALINIWQLYKLDVK